MNNKLTIDPLPDFPDFNTMQHWLDHVGAHINATYHVDCTSVSDVQMASLNGRYRNKYRPTNILSFTHQDEQEIIGSLVFCKSVIENELQALDIPTLDYWAHLFIHGLLHLAGHDHEVEADRIAMESLETQLLHELGMESPYEAL